MRMGTSGTVNARSRMVDDLRESLNRFLEPGEHLHEALELALERALSVAQNENSTEDDARRSYDDLRRAIASRIKATRQ